MKVLLLWNGDGDELEVVMEDGGNATIYYEYDDHETPKPKTQYYQNRIEDLECEDLWQQLADGESYIKIWEDKDIIDQDVIDDAIEWLCQPTQKHEYITDKTIYDPKKPWKETEIRSDKVKEFLIKNKK